MKLITAFILLFAGNLWAFDENAWLMKDGKMEKAKWKIELTTFVPVESYYSLTDWEKDLFLEDIEGLHTYKVIDLSKIYDKDVVAISTNSVFGNFDDFRKSVTDKEYIKRKVIEEVKEIEAAPKAESLTGIDFKKEKEKREGKASHLKKVHDKL